MNKKLKGFRHILMLSKGCKRFFVISLVASFLTTMLNAISPQIMKITIDSIIGDEAFDLPVLLLNIVSSVGGRDFFRANLFIPALLILGASILSGLCNFVGGIATSEGSEKFVKKLRDTLFGHIQKLPYAWHVKNKTGDIIQRCTSDVEIIKNFVGNQALEIIRTCFLIIFALTLMFSMNVKLSFIALSFIPFVFAYSAIYFVKVGNTFQKVDEAEGTLSATVQENLTGVRVVRAFGRENFEIERFNKNLNSFADRLLNMGGILGNYWGIGDFFSGLQIMTIVVLGCIDAVNGKITLGEFIAFASYNATLTWPIRSLGRVLSEMSKSGVSLERVNYILDSEEEKDAPNSIEPPLNKDICFKHINFNYEGLMPILKDVNFTIKSGSTFAILGNTGSGKSTLMHLLNRLYDLPAECGSIEIGGININNIKRDWIRKNIGMVLQEPFLFSKTIQENISAANPKAKLTEIRNAAKIACVDEAISEFTNGYDTIVGERGVTLSGGQKQRVAIARMLLQNSPIMVFDDSLSAVDSETDSKIRKALKDNLGKSTVILISHRITTLMQADTIMVLDDGKIAEIGTHQELLNNNGIYKEIYDIQMSSEDKLLIKEETN